MVYLDSTRALALSTEVGVTSAVEFVSAAMSDDGSSLVYVANDGQANGTADVDIVPAPSAGTVKIVKHVAVMNRDTVARTVTIKLVSGANTRELFVSLLQPGRMLAFDAGAGWAVRDAHGRIESPGVAGAHAAVQYNQDGAFAGATHVAIHGDDLLLEKTTTSVTTPPVDTVKLFARIGARALLSIKGPSGQDTALQPHIGGNRIGLWLPPGNATTAPLADGIAAPTATGTATARNVATTSLPAAMRRLGYVSAAAAGNLCGARLAVAQLFRGNSSAKGGFHIRIRFVPSDAATVAGARTFVGLSASTAAPTNVEPNTQVNVIGVCGLSTSNNMFLIWNDGTGVCSQIDLGASFPINTLSTDAYELELFCPSGGGNVRYLVENLVTEVVAAGELDANLPAETTLLTVQLWRCNNTSGLAVGIDLVSLYLETDY